MGAVVQVFAFVFLLAACVACGIGFFSPNWVNYDPLSDVDKEPTSVGDVVQTADQVIDSIGGMVENIARTGRIILTQGLMARCYVEVIPTVLTMKPNKKCQFFWDDDFEMERTLPTWHKVSQGLYVIGCLTFGLSLALACCGCCYSKSSSLPNATGSFTILAVLALVTSIVVFGVFVYKQQGLRLPSEIDSDGTMGGLLPNNGGGRLAWGAIVAIVGVLLAIVAAIMFQYSGCSGRRYQRNYGGDTERMILG